MTKTQEAMKREWALKRWLEPDTYSRVQDVVDGWSGVFPSLSVVDHGEVWRRDERIVCVTAHSYAPDIVEDHEDIEQIRAAGLTVIVHPVNAKGSRSWYYPGWTGLVEIWAKGAWKAGA